MVVFFKQKTAYEMRISDWSSDVCSSDLPKPPNPISAFSAPLREQIPWKAYAPGIAADASRPSPSGAARMSRTTRPLSTTCVPALPTSLRMRSEEHTSELQSLMRISYAVFCLKKNKKQQHTSPHNHTLMIIT